MAGTVNINIYLTKSDKTALDKTLENKIELYGEFKDPTNVLNPSIEIQANAASIAARNYFEIPIFGRKYFLTEVTSVGYGRCVITGHVDVLSTYKDQIRNLEGVIARQENRYNLLLDDNLYKVQTNPYIQIKTFKDGGSFSKNPGICLVVCG